MEDVFYTAGLITSIISFLIGVILWQYIIIKEYRTRLDDFIYTTELMRVDLEILRDQVKGVTKERDKLIVDLQGVARELDELQTEVDSTAALEEDEFDA